jgi:hypothetical protein
METQSAVQASASGNLSLKIQFISVKTFSMLFHVAPRCPQEFFAHRGLEILLHWVSQKGASEMKTKALGILLAILSKSPTSLPKDETRTAIQILLSNIPFKMWLKLLQIFSTTTRCL